MHLSSFCLTLDLVTVQCTSLVEYDWTDIYAGAEQQYDQPKLFIGYSIWDGLGWLTTEALELAGLAPLCIENPKGRAQVGWTPTGLCQIQTLKHVWEAQTDAWAAVLTGALCMCGSHGWPYLPRNWTGHCTWGWPYSPAQVQKLL